MDYVYIFIGGFVVGVFVFKRELLIERANFRIILGISVILFLVGVILHFTYADQHSSCGALLAPLLTLGLFRLCRKVFLRLFSREPKDTWLIWDAGMGVDRAFNIIYFSLAGLLLMLITTAMIELVKAGF